MKKTILYTVCLAVLTMTGCDKTVLEFPENRVLRAVGTLQSVGSRSARRALDR